MKLVTFQNLDQVEKFIDALTQAIFQVLPGEYTVAVMASRDSTVIAKASSTINNGGMTELHALDELLGNNIQPDLGEETRIHIGGWTFSVYGRHPRERINDVTLVNEDIRNFWRISVLEALNATLNSYSDSETSETDVT